MQLDQLKAIIRRRKAVNDDGSTQWRSRATLAGVVALCVTATTLAVTTAGADTSGQKFLQSGHLIYNSTIGAVFHIDGGSKRADGSVGIPGLPPGTQAVQTDTKGYVLSRGNISAFEKSTLHVEEPKPAPSNETPVGLAAAGVAYSVYQNAGSIVRLGPTDLVLPGKDGLGRPVITPDGTLWVQRSLSGELCQLPATAGGLTCPAQLERGTVGSLSVVGDRVVFVDTMAGEIRTVSSSGFGRPLAIPGLALAPDAIVVPNDVNGRIAIVEPDKSRLRLVDTVAITGGTATGPAAVERELPAGKFTQVASSGQNLALVDEAGTKLVTLDADGKQKDSKLIPQPTFKPSKDDRPLLTRGADQRLYVDSVGGEQALVVDRDGSVSEPVPASGPTTKPTPSATPTTKPTIVPTPPTTPRPPVTDPSIPPRRTTDPGGTKTAPPPRKVDPPRHTEEPRQPVNPPRTTQKPPPPPKPTQKPPSKPKPPPPIVATPAAAPISLRAVGGNGKVSLTWKRPSLNGGTFLSYRVSRVNDSGPDTTTSARYTSTGLDDGKRYTFQVRTVTRGSNGKTLIGAAATVSATTGAGAAPSIRISRGPKYTGDYKPCENRDYCYYIHIVARGFKPNTTYTFTGHTLNYGILHSDSLKVGPDGSLTVNKFYNDDEGGTVWVTVGDQESNKVKW
ncbi:fibronectin type III domain-containing protein [Kribbella antibiotica]|uniref:Fibronectin type III domain-containing protein n=1 Tax=Kribbella antibiotica TaxID=190195 RepID=A0A4R4ZRX9_9ACTN|nr:fibronectin type III domain-containing protein [Kribbella antibiotica]TDD61798.1 fibronectin type III domain-containing protein [Kribbella antibiotica]